MFVNICSLSFTGVIIDVAMFTYVVIIEESASICWSIDFKSSDEHSLIDELEDDMCFDISFIVFVLM
jgi:hypothetical protein